MFSLSATNIEIEFTAFITTKLSLSDSRNWQENFKFLHFSCIATADNPLNSSYPKTLTQATIIFPGFPILNLFLASKIEFALILVERWMTSLFGSLYVMIYFVVAITTSPFCWLFPNYYLNNRDTFHNFIIKMESYQFLRVKTGIFP